MSKLRVWDTTDKHYRFYDATTSYGTFTSLTGGDMKISMIPYTVVGVNGSPVEKYLPGQISYAPINMSCPFSNVVMELKDWFQLAAEGNYDNLRRNCSITQYTMNILPAPYDLLTWELINAVPVALPGYSYNSTRGTSSTKFKIAIQAEEIRITFPNG